MSSLCKRELTLHCLAVCRNVTVEPSIIRKRQTATLNFSHFGLGNARAEAVCACLADLPMVQHVDMSENRLSDDVVASVFDTLAHRHGVESINLSRNVFGPRAAKYVRRCRGCNDANEAALVTNTAVDTCKLLAWSRALMTYTSISHGDLVTLSLNRCRITNMHAKTLASCLQVRVTTHQWPHYTERTHLDLPLS